jgi:hypothetical protein
MKFQLVAALAAALTLVASGAFAQSAAQNPLARVKSLTCTFGPYSVGVWKNGEPQAQIKDARLSLQIDEIDTDGGTARVTGTSGPVHVTALLTVSSLHLMERSVTGTLNVTTIFAVARGAQKLRAVHSRHDYLQMSIPGFESEPTVSQSYGTCDAVQ